MVTIEPNQIYSYQELKELLGMGKYTARKIIKNGQISGRKISGNAYVFTGQQVLNYLNGKTSDSFQKEQ